MLKNAKIIKIRPRLRGPLEHQSFFYITRLCDMGENSKTDFFQFFHLKYFPNISPCLHWIFPPIQFLRPYTAKTGVAWGTVEHWAYFGPLHDSLGNFRMETDFCVHTNFWPKWTFLNSIFWLLTLLVPFGIVWYATHCKGHSAQIASF